jgi:hypothetical protein
MIAINKETLLDDNSMVKWFPSLSAAMTAADIEAFK